MRRRSGAFRPAAGELLETRAVPTTGLGGFLGGLLGGITPLPVQDAYAVRRDFNTFERTFATDVRTILAPNGSVPTAATTAAFNAAIQGTTGTNATPGAIGTLNAAIAADLKNLTATGPNLISTITPEITALQAAVTAPAVTTSTNTSSVRTFERQALRAIENTESQVVGQVANDKATGTAISQSTERSLYQAVQSAFRTFNQTYYGDVQNDLLGTPANTAKFTTDVGVAITTLNANIANSAAFKALPTQVSSTLATTITNDLLSATPVASPDNSLQGVLAGITLQNPSSRISRFFFNLRSSLAVSAADAQVNYDIANAIQTYNNGLY